MTDHDAPDDGTGREPAASHRRSDNVEEPEETAPARPPAIALEPATTTVPPRGLARLAGAVAAGVALGVGELVSAVGGPDQSLVGGVGTEFINRFAGSLKDIAVALFGTNDKVALVVGIVVISLGCGAILGQASLARRRIGALGFAAFGALGAFAGLGDELADNKLLVLVASVAAVVAGVVALDVLLRIAEHRRPLPITTTRRIEVPTDPAATRRAFFGWAGAAGAFAATAAVGGRALAQRSGVEQARRAIRLPTTGTTALRAPPGTGVPPFDVTGLTPYYMPNDEFYRIDTALITPQVDPASWRLAVTGMVDRPFTLTFDELLALPQTEEAVTLSCVSNEVGGDLVGNAKWLGVPLRTLLDRAGVQAGATQIVGESVDGWTAGFPTSVALDGRVAMVAVGMNGEPLPIPHGFPARLVVSGLYGYVSATKWLREIRLTRWEDFDGYWMDKGWSKEGPIKTQSRIDVPRSGARLAPGPTRIAGVAWAPSLGIRRIEVQVDDGPWRDATLGDVVSDNTWVQWVIDWEATVGSHLLRVRATDGTGATQTSQTSLPAPDGATGWHTRRVRVE